MASNEYLRHHVDVATYRFAAGNAATGFHSLGTFIPAGAIVNKISFYGPTAMGYAAGASGSVAVYLGTAMMQTGGVLLQSVSGHKVIKLFGTTAASVGYVPSVDKEVKVQFSKNVLSGTTKIIVDYYTL